MRLKRYISPVEVEDRERIKGIASRASLSLVRRIAFVTARHAGAEHVSSDDLEVIIDELTATIENLNDWKGVLTWLEDE